MRVGSGLERPGIAMEIVMRVRAVAQTVIGQIILMVYV
jgi:hypothetical protein